MLLSFIISSILLAISPGPDNIYIATLTSRSGKISGFSFLMGLLIGCFIHTILLAFGLNAMIIQVDFIFNLIKYFGALYLIYLSIEVYKSDDLFKKNNKLSNSDSILINLKKGIMMNLLNPKVFLFFALFFPNFLFSETISFKIQIIIMGLIFIIITLFVFGIIILFSNVIFNNFSQESKFKLYAKFFNILVLIVIAAIILFAENSITLS
ncbi:MAG: LysE family translocator [Bacteroidetes bacterium]|jgi:threonine/homoserine/homoserine lactone efflux protein|nr:MAG: LysE family translocator [Bacteroidota bacterium]|tara:strand:- start:789 stop:1418 length:630 start_codon:yes stop_codon:yes gene_type:complete